MSLFTENPLVMSLSNALGLGAITGEASSINAANQGSAAPPPAAPTQAPAKSAQNVPAYKNRPYLPPAPRGVGLGAHDTASPFVGPTGMLDPAILQHPDVQNMLQQYGVDASQIHPDPNVFIHNPDAFNNHPVLSNIIERGMEGIAAYQPGRDVGESFQNVIRSVAGANNMRSQQVNAQVQAPFQTAETVANLQRIGLQNQSIQHGMDYQDNILDERQKQDAAVDKYHDDLVGAREDAAQLRAKMKEMATDPEIGIHQQYMQNGMATLTQKYGSVDKIPKEDLQDLAASWMSSKDKASMQRTMAHVAGTTTAASIHANASMYGTDHRAAGGAKVTNNPDYLAAGRQIQESKDAIKNLKTVGMQSADPLHPNQQLVGGTPKANQAILFHQKRIQDLQAQRDGIKSGGAAPSPAQSSGNSNPYLHR